MSSVTTNVTLTTGETMRGLWLRMFKEFHEHQAHDPVTVVVAFPSEEPARDFFAYLSGDAEVARCIEIGAIATAVCGDPQRVSCGRDGQSVWIRMQSVSP